MPWDILTGTFTRENPDFQGPDVWQQDRDQSPEIRIRADRHDFHDQDLAAGINEALTKSGINSPTADLPMAGHRHTGVGDAQARTDYAPAGQVQDGRLIWGGTATGTGDAIVIALTPALTALVAGCRVGFLALAATSGAAATLDAGPGPVAFKRKDGSDFGSVDIAVGDFVEAVYIGAQWRWANQPGQLAVTGDYMTSASTGARAGYVRANGRTIGSASSGGTERANADTATLYALLWDGYANTILAIQDSSGSATTRGASAAADFAANKRLPLPDLRGRGLVGVDDMGNSAASRVTSTTATPNGTTLGASGGAQTHTLITNEMPVHAHTPLGTPGTSFSQQLSGSSVQSGVGAIVPDTGAGQTANAGGGAAHNNMPPFWLATVYIRL